MDDGRIPIDPNDTLATSTADPVNNPAGDGVVVSADAAAQGRTGLPMLMVLGASLALVVLVLFGMYAFHLGPLSTNRGAGGQSGLISNTDAASFHEPAPAPKPNPPPEQQPR